MENASKALMIAAEVLLGVLLISGAVYLFTQSGGFASDYYKSIEKQEKQAFNAQFEKYNVQKTNIYDDNGDYIETVGITANDIITLINLAQKINIDNPNKLQIYIGNVSYTDYNEQNKNEFIKNNVGQYYEIKETKYTDGLVSLMRFKSI